MNLPYYIYRSQDKISKFHSLLFRDAPAAEPPNEIQMLEDVEAALRKLGAPTYSMDACNCRPNSFLELRRPMRCGEAVGGWGAVGTVPTVLYLALPDRGLAQPGIVLYGSLHNVDGFESSQLARVGTASHGFALWQVLQQFARHLEPGILDQDSGIYGLQTSTWEHWSEADREREFASTVRLVFDKLGPTTERDVCGLVQVHRNMNIRPSETSVSSTWILGSPLFIALEAPMPE